MENELQHLITKYKEGDHNSFLTIYDKMKPLIIKYSRILRFNDFEDMKAEFILTLLECIENMKFYESEKQVLSYMNRAVINRFHELYRSSTLQNNEVYVDDDHVDLFDNLSSYYPSEFSNILFETDILSFILSLPHNKQTIARTILLEGLSDIETGKRHQKSRQYIHQLRKEFYTQLKELYFT